MQWNCKGESGTTQSKKAYVEKPGTKTVSSYFWANTTSEPTGVAYQILNGVPLVRVEDKGSKVQLSLVEITGVPVSGIVDTSADITIMGQNC